METHKNPGRPRPDPLRRLQPAVKNALTFRNSLRTPLHAFGVDDAGSISLLFFLKHHSQGGSLLPSEGGLLLHSAEASGCVFARIFDPGVRKKRSPLANLCPPRWGGRTSPVSSKYEMRVISRTCRRCGSHGCIFEGSDGVRNTCCSLNAELQTSFRIQQFHRLKAEL